MDYQIFISYRREGGEDLAGRISDKLTGRGYRVFYDIESMRSGAFNDQIYHAIDACEDVLVILPPNGLDRCRDAGDWVRLEIEYAIKQKKNIIPIMMRGFSFPEVLPDSIDCIRYFDGVGASTEYFDAVIGKIEHHLKSTLISNTTPPPPENADLNMGKRFINSRVYPQAIASLERAMQSDMANPEVYFYLSAAYLGGKRPFLVPKAKIDRAIEYLTVAASIEDRAIYHYFLAYIKHDHHYLKQLRVNPDFVSELRFSEQLEELSEAEKDALYTLLGTARPVDF